MKTVAIIFGRLSPPTLGHMLLIDKLSQVEADDHFVYLSHSYDPIKNPLSYNDKVMIVKSCVKEHFHNVTVKESDAKTICEVLKELSGKYSEVTLVVGGDRLEEFNTLVQKYNGVPDKKGSILYSFDSINVLSAGNRDPDAEGLEGMSASKLRQAALDKDFDTFKKGVATSDEDLAFVIYTKVRQGMKLTEAPVGYSKAGKLAMNQYNRQQQDYKNQVKALNKTADVSPKSQTDEQSVNTAAPSIELANSPSIAELCQQEYVETVKSLDTTVKSPPITPTQKLRLLFIMGDPITKDHETIIDEFFAKRGETQQTTVVTQGPVVEVPQAAMRPETNIQDDYGNLDYVSESLKQAMRLRRFEEEASAAIEHSYVFILPAQGPAGKNGLIISEHTVRYACARLLLKNKPYVGNIVTGEDPTQFIKPFIQQGLQSLDFYYQEDISKIVQKIESNINRFNIRIGKFPKAFSINTWDKPNRAIEALRLSKNEYESIKKDILGAEDKADKKQESFYMNKFARQMDEFNNAFREKDEVYSKLDNNDIEGTNIKLRIKNRVQTTSAARFKAALPKAPSNIQTTIYSLYFLRYEIVSARSDKLANLIADLAGTILGDPAKLAGMIANDLGFGGVARGVGNIATAASKLSKNLRGQDPEEKGFGATLAARTLASPLLTAKSGATSST